jgi:energy-coupling factor transporter ATP-binding protein EcfA2
MIPLSHLQIRNPKDDETPIEAATQIFSSLLPQPYVPLWKRWFIKPKTYAFELYLLNQTIYFYVTSPANNETLIQSLIASSFPTSAIKKTTDPLDIIFKSKKLAVGEVALNSSFFLPTKTYFDFKDVDPLSSLIGFLAKQPAGVSMAIQILVTLAYFNWQDKAVEQAGKMHYDPSADRYTQSPQKMLIMKKASFQGGKAVIRLLVGINQQNINPFPYLQNLAGTFGSFSLGEGNQYVFKYPLIFKNLLLKRIKNRQIGYFERRFQVLNAQELATIWHPPGYLLAGIKNLAWGKTLKGEPPENLPIVPLHPGDGDAGKKDINFFAKTEFKNKEQIFGIKTADRRKHIYIIGKTGSGKSTLIANMAIDDIRKDRGVGIIDPHGDLSETILDFIPKRRQNDVVYLEPFDTERPFSLNVLEVKNKQQKDLIASGIVSIFYKLYKDSWGPRLEYILRNVILTLLETPGTTLVDVISLLSHQDYRKKVVNQLKDPVLKSFWEKEFAKMPDRLKAEAISPIQNKVGQFVTSKMIRNIIGRAKSSIDLEQIMNEGKILILNLSQGKLGEDNAALLGAMIITQIQLAAMNRSFIKEEERRDFFLYVDEFQNFATTSFTKILSEARKYRLSLTLANQYIDQLELPIQKAIFGNVGTLISFVVGARDAYILSKEFGEIYEENDLVSLGKYEAVMKLCIDNMTSSPFPAKTLPLPSLKNANGEIIIRLSKEKFGRKI